MNLSYQIVGTSYLVEDHYTKVGRQMDKHGLVAGRQQVVGFSYQYLRAIRAIVGLDHGPQNLILHHFLRVRVSMVIFPWLSCIQFDRDTLLSVAAHCSMCMRKTNVRVVTWISSCSLQSLLPFSLKVST